MLIDYAHILLISVLIVPLLSAVILWMLPQRLTFVSGIALAITWMIATCVLLPELTAQKLTLSWALSADTSSMFNVIQLRAGLEQSGLLLTAPLMVGLGMLVSQKTASRILLCLIGFCLQILAVSDDVGSWLSALVAGALCLATLTSEGGETQDRERARSLLTRQTVGAVLLFTGWAMLVAIVAQVKVAPFGTPGTSTSVISELGEMLQEALARHPAAIEVWAQYELLPVLVVGLAFFVLVPLFPFEFGIGESLQTHSKATRVALILWSRILLLSLFQNFLLACQPSQFFSYIILALYVGLAFVSFTIYLEREPQRVFAKLVSWSAHLMSLMLLGSPFTLSPAHIQIAFASQTIGLATLMIAPNIRLSILSAFLIIVVPIGIGLLGNTVPSWGGGSLIILFLTAVVATAWAQRVSTHR